MAVARVKEWIAGEVLYATHLNAEFDAAMGDQMTEPSNSAQGDILIRNASEWTRLGYGTSGQFLKTQGIGANPAWATATDGTMTTQGDMLYRGASANARLAKGTAYYFLRMNSGATAPEWTNTLSTNLVIGENVGFTLDVALSADGKYCAISQFTGTAGDDLAFGQVVYFASADSKWELTDADAEASTKPKAAIVIVAGDEDATVTLMDIGTIREDDWAWTTPGAPLFLSTTAGGLSESAPSGSGDCVRVMGYVIDSNSIWFCPENAWDELA